MTEYRVGKFLAIRTASNGFEAFKLDDQDVSADIGASVAVGSPVRVTEKLGDGGKRLITVEPQRMTEAPPKS